MNTFRNNVNWRFSGFATRDAAEKALEAEIAWFNQTFNANEWQITTTVQGTPRGWAVEYTAVKSGVSQ